MRWRAASHKTQWCQIGAKKLECESDAEHLDRIEREFGIEAAFDVGSLPETVLLADEQEIPDRVSVASQCLDHDECVMSATTSRPSCHTKECFDWYSAASHDWLMLQFNLVLVNPVP